MRRRSRARVPAVMAAPEPESIPQARRGVRVKQLRDSYRYGYVLLLTVVSLAFQMAAPDHTLPRLLVALLEAFTLGLVFWASQRACALTGSPTQRIVIGLALTGIAALDGSGPLERGVAALVGFVLTAAAAAAIARGVIRGYGSGIR